MASLENVNYLVKKELKTSKSRQSSGNEGRQEYTAEGNARPHGRHAEKQKMKFDRALKNVSGYVQNITRELDFSVDEALNQYIVTVFDQKTGEIIRQIPAEDLMELANKLDEAQKKEPKGILRGLLFKTKV